MFVLMILCKVLYKCVSMLTGPVQPGQTLPEPRQRGTHEAEPAELCRTGRNLGRETHVVEMARKLRIPQLVSLVEGQLWWRLV